MDANVRRRALEITAKITLSLAVLSLEACASASSRDDEDTLNQSGVEAARDEGSAAYGRRADGGEDEGAACGARKDGIDEVSAENAACCTDFFATNTVDTGSWPQTRLAPDADTAQAAHCCAALSQFSLAHPEDTASALAVESLHWGVCCEFSPNPMACTPWGPPMPPSMPAGFDPFADLDGAREVA